LFAYPTEGTKLCQGGAGIGDRDDETTHHVD
jgi:hypothetical protein